MIQTKTMYIFSIAHSGTRTLESLTKPDKIYHARQVGHMLVELLAGEADQRILIPMRHPNLIWQSWARRQYTRDEVRTIDLGASWSILGMLLQLRPDASIIPVDLPDIAIPRLQAQGYPITEIPTIGQHDASVPPWLPPRGYTSLAYLSVPQLNTLYPIHQEHL